MRTEATTSYKIETLAADGTVLFTTTRKTEAAATRYAASVEAKPSNVRYGIATRVTTA